MNRDLFNSTAIPATARIAPQMLVVGQSNGRSDPTGPFRITETPISAPTLLEVAHFIGQSNGWMGETDAAPRRLYLMCGSSNAVLAPEPFDMRAWLDSQITWYNEPTR